MMRQLYPDERKRKSSKQRKNLLTLRTIQKKNKYKEKNNNSIKQEVDSDDESRFNSEEYHKKQHDF